jgi:hypothetical protein
VRSVGDVVAHLATRPKKNCLFIFLLGMRKMRNEFSKNFACVSCQSDWQASIITNKEEANHGAVEH